MDTYRLNLRLFFIGTQPLKQKYHKKRNKRQQWRSPTTKSPQRRRKSKKNREKEKDDIYQHGVPKTWPKSRLWRQKIEASSSQGKTVRTEISVKEANGFRSTYDNDFVLLWYVCLGWVENTTGTKSLGFKVFPGTRKILSGTP